MSESNLSDFSMMDLFKAEVDNHSAVLTEGLLRLESGTAMEQEEIKSLMRAAHSIKGAARVVNLDAGVEIAHALEDCFIAAQDGKIVLKPEYVDLFFQAIDLIKALSLEKELEKDVVENIISKLEDIKESKPEVKVEESVQQEIQAPAEEGRRLRISTENLDSLMAIAEETIVEIRSLNKVKDSLLKIKKKHADSPAGQDISSLLDTLESFSRRSDHLAERMHREIVTNRMRPFLDILEGFPRMVRDIARTLGKKVRLNVIGGQTLVDMDILEKLSSPLNHLLRNAVDHGIEQVEERRSFGKSEEGQITMEAAHQAGMLKITVSDDGRGMDFDFLRQKVVDKGMVNAAMGEKLSEKELLDFIFLPSFSSKTEVTEYSGRGVGLDVVYDMAQEVKGIVRAESQKGVGMTFHLYLPLTLSVVSALIVDVDGERYAFPLERIEQASMLDSAEIKDIDGKDYFSLEGVDVGVSFASEIFGGEKKSLEALPLIVISDQLSRYGVVVDSFLGEQSLVVNKLDPSLGYVPNVNSASILDDGTTVLIVDVSDFVRSVDNKFLGRHEPKKKGSKKRILIVDDSETVRKEASGLLDYETEVAVDGQDGWNATRLFDYDLVITDIDMPRMNGFELISLMRADEKLKNMPIIILSYKKDDETKQRAAELGIEHCLTKKSFSDGTFVKTVANLIEKG